MQALRLRKAASHRSSLDALVLPVRGGKADAHEDLRRLMTLLHLSYVSRLSPGLSVADLLDEIGHFRARNLEAGISGCIAFEGDRIMQILEGPEAGVNALFQAICRDPRHVEVIELERKTIEAVSFRDWGMVRRPIADVVFLSQLT